MNKRYRKFERLIGDMRRLIENPESVEERYDLYHLTSQLAGFVDELTVDAEKVRELLEVAGLLRDSNAQGRLIAEKEILSFLAFLADMCRVRPGLDSEREGVEDDCGKVLREIHGFAVGCFSFKRARDTFGGRRRSGAFTILGAVGPVGDSTEVIALATLALEKGGRNEALAALEFFGAWLNITDKEPDDALIDSVWRMIDRAESDTGVIAGLDTLVQWGVIGEFEAMTHLDDWREKHGDEAW